MSVRRLWQTVPKTYKGGFLQLTYIFRAQSVRFFIGERSYIFVPVCELLIGEKNVDLFRCMHVSVITSHPFIGYTYVSKLHLLDSIDIKENYKDDLISQFEFEIPLHCTTSIGAKTTPSCIYKFNWVCPFSIIWRHDTLVRRTRNHIALQRKNFFWQNKSVFSSHCTLSDRFTLPLDALCNSTSFPYQ